ncbi:MAG: hypothetical protein AB1629_01330 [Candidatus Omnitrophota bacterium]
MRKILFLSFLFILLTYYSLNYAFADRPFVPCPSQLENRFQIAIGANLNTFNTSIHGCSKEGDEYFISLAYIDIMSQKGNIYPLFISLRANSSYIIYRNFRTISDVKKLINFIENLPIYKQYEDKIKSAFAYKVITICREGEHEYEVSFSPNRYTPEVPLDIRLSFDKWLIFQVVNDESLQIFIFDDRKIERWDFSKPKEIIDIKHLHLSSGKFKY